jgi:mannose-1-phosphate guanylyltransferase
LSRKRRPKQAIPLLGGDSLFELTLKRLAPLAPPSRTFVITSAEQARLLRSQAPRLPRSNVIAEPVPRDSAAAIFLAASIISAKDPGAVMLVCPADHLISPDGRFQKCVAEAVRVAQGGEYLVTFGVKPSSPATGYGYVERSGALRGQPGAFRVKRFREKPDLGTARRYVKSARFYWNSGMFVWRASTILGAAEAFAPDHYKAIAPLGGRFGKPGFARALSRAYRPLKKISIDFAVMEKAPNIAMVEADFDWSDVGSPLALRECSTLDESGNVRHGLTEFLDSANCVAMSEDNHLLAVFGCRDLVIIHTRDATLLCPSNRVEEVKSLIAAIGGRRGLQRFL